MIKDIKIGNKILGLNRDVFICVEVGTTCNGEVETAKKLIDASKYAGVDAIKFQDIDSDDMYSDKTLTYSYERHNKEKVTENIYEMLKKYEFSLAEWREIKEYADQKGVLIFSSVDSMGAVKRMEELDMPAYKIGTWDVTFVPLLKKVARLGKPTFLDLGASDLGEVARLVKIFQDEGNDKIVLVHCYHTNNHSDMNLRTIEYLRKTFGYMTGFASADAGNDIDFFTLAYDPVFIEKRLTLDKTDPGHHHARAIEPEEMKLYVKRIRELSKAKGHYALIPSAGDLKDKQENFRRIVSKRSIKQGEKLTESNIACRRPYYGGIDSTHYDLVLGRTIKKNMKENEPITWDII